MSWRERLFIIVLLSGSAAIALVFVALIPVLPLIADHFGGGKAGITLAQQVMTMPALGMIAGGFGSAWAIRAVGSMRLLFIGLTLYVISGTAGLWIDSAVGLLATRGVLGLAASMTGIGATAIIAGRYSEDMRAGLLGYKQAVGALGGIVGTLAGGALGDWGGWRPPFAVYLLPLVLIALLLAFRPKDSGKVAEPAAANAVAGSVLGLWPFYVMIVGFGIVLMMTATQLSFLLAEIDIRAPGAVSRVAVTASIGSAFGGFGYGRFRKLIGADGCFPAIFGIWAVGLMTLGFSYSATAVVLGCAITGFSAGLFLPHMISTLVARAAPDVRDRAIALFYSAVFLGDFLNPLVVEPISTALTRHGAFRAVGLFCAAAMIVSLVMRRRNARGVERSPSRV